MQDWWFFLLIGLGIGFVIGGEWRHRLFKKQDRALMEDQIRVMRDHILLLKAQLTANKSPSF
ncbi:MAG TPA: hypothetical protein VFA65_24465 [Bryobacteraceae bacterium]|nr:hypothetical protein [Bryobacteraceae bacterium]